MKCVAKGTDNHTMKCLSTIWLGAVWCIKTDVTKSVTITTPFSLSKIYLSLIPWRAQYVRAVICILRNATTTICTINVHISLVSTIATGGFAFLLLSFVILVIFTHCCCKNLCKCTQYLMLYVKQIQCQILHKLA